MTAALVARGVTVATRLAETDVVLAGGTLTGLIGPNGSGKTSLLRRLAEIDTGKGTVHVTGRLLSGTSPAERRHLLCFLPASRELAWPLRVRDVIALGLARPDPARISELLVLLELDDMAERSMDRLSTGERARVLLARALAPRPRVLLLDEPLSNLDPAWVLRSIAVMRDAASAGAAVLMSLHDLTLVRACDRVLLIGNGVVREDGDPAIILESEAITRWFGVRGLSGAGGWELA